MLSISGLNVSLDQAPILREAALSVPTGKFVGLIGRNGAGKTTLMRSIMGLLKPDQGSIMLGKRELAHRPAFQRAHLEVGYMPEDRRLVPDLTVEENILLPAWSTHRQGVEAQLAWIYELIPEIVGLSSRTAMSLSGGQQKLVALARALMIGRKLLLLDEPFEGVAPVLCKRLVEVLQVLKSEGLSVLVSESDYTHTAKVVDSSYLIERGIIS